MLFLLQLLFLTSTHGLPPIDSLAVILFGSLVVFTMLHGIKLTEGQVSLLPMVAVATYLVMGPVAATWLVWAGVLISGPFSYVRSRRNGLLGSWDERLDLFDRTAVNALMMPVGILFGSLIYELMVDWLALDSVSYPILILFWGVGYFFINYLFITLFFATRDKTALRRFWQNMPQPLLFEVIPLPFAPLIARIYTDLGRDYFLILLLGIVMITLTIQYLNEIGMRLNRRDMELDSLKNVGKTLGAGLEIDSVMAAIRVQVLRLMPAQMFYIALYDPNQNRVTFPFAMQGEQRMTIAARQDGHGLVEHVLVEKRPLLIPKNVAATAQSLDLAVFGQEPACWLGVPIMLADAPIGVIVVESYDQSSLYDEWHQDVLTTIATQAAMAIHNARLYAQTGSELDQRVQELNSILSTIHEGTLLVSLEGQIITANRILTEFIGLPDDELEGRSLFARDTDDDLLAKIGYEFADWQADCAALAQGEKWHTAHIVMSGSQRREVERTLVPVRDEASVITGWLLIFRDITEEIELSKSREETIHMLVHDLRSPLSVTMGSLETMNAWLEMGRTDDVRRLLDLANTGGQRMLQLLNNLLDSYKFESGTMPLTQEAIPVLPWLADLKAQFAPAAAIANLSLDLNVEPGLPMLWADKGHMTRVISNLVDNAIKFTPDGGNIELWARCPNDGECTILMGVSDNGLGIPLEEQAKLFDKFRQRADVRGRRQGTGLGLTYCKLVVEAHNGRIWIESEGVKGQGSTFVMVLPAFDEQQT